MKVILNGAEFEVDFLDYDFLTMCEEQYEVLEKKATELVRNSEEIRQSEMIMKGTQPIHDFFNHILGEGAAEKIFHGKINYRIALETLGEFGRYKDSCGTEIAELNQKYSKPVNIAETKQNPNPNKQPRKGNRKRANYYAVVNK